MKYLILLAIIFSTQFVYSQTNYSKGFTDGYNKGYCYGKLNGCLVGVVPVAPIPKIGESYENYLDGYDNGFLSGRKAADQPSLSQPQETVKNEMSAAQGLPEISLFKPDFQFYQQILGNLTQPSSYNQHDLPDLSEHDQEVINELNDPVKVKQQIQYIDFLRNYYAQQSMLPSHLPDGNYQATRISDPHSVETVDVVVKNNCVIMIRDVNPFSKKYDYTLDVNDYPDYKDQVIVNVVRQPVNITFGKATYSPETTGKPTGEESTRKFYQNDFVYELYFLDYIAYYQQAQKKISEIRREYQSKTKFQNIPDGWIICYATDGEGFCDIRKVYVQAGKITTYRTGQGIDCSISSGGVIINGRSNISYYPKDNNGNIGPMNVFELYFL